jgi:carbon storage regulator
MFSDVILKATAGDLKGRELVLDHPGEYTLGRSPDCAIQVPDALCMISRHHCRVVFEPLSVRVRDLGFVIFSRLLTGRGRRFPPDHRNAPGNRIGEVPRAGPHRRATSPGKPSGNTQGSRSGVQGGNAMLVLSRCPGEEIVIDGGIRITVVEIRGGRVRLGITAPASVGIARHEVHERRAQFLSTHSASVPVPPPLPAPRPRAAVRRRLVPVRTRTRSTRPGSPPAE